MMEANCEVAKRGWKGFIGFMKNGSVVTIDPEIMSGTPCFTGTRVPVRVLLDHLEAGDGLDVFLADFPTVSRARAIQYLEESAAAMIAALLRGNVFKL